MWASTTDDNAVYEQSDKRMCQLINIRGTSISAVRSPRVSHNRKPCVRGAPGCERNSYEQALNYLYYNSSRLVNFTIESSVTIHGRI